MKTEIINQPDVDMSPEAIDERFRLVESLRKLCVSLRDAGMRGPLEERNDSRDARLEAKRRP